MRITVVLAVGMDSWQLTAERSMWNTAGYFFVPATSIRDAMNHFKAGDFDLVLLGHLISAEDKERLTRSIRACSSSTQVVSIAGPQSNYDYFADATLRSDSGDLLMNMRELLDGLTRVPPPRTVVYSDVN
jgi:DNA-binding NtrC family response regulator